MIVVHAKILKGFWEKSKGLIGADPMYPIFFTTRWGIHTFGMKVPIDIVILDDDMKVVKLAPQLAPNRIFLWHPRFRNVLELPKGSIEKKKMSAGIHLSLHASSTMKS